MTAKLQQPLFYKYVAKDWKVILMDFPLDKSTGLVKLAKKNYVTTLLPIIESLSYRTLWKLNKSSISILKVPL